jgi:hypothetical protein
MILGRHIVYTFPISPFCLIPYTLSTNGILANIPETSEKLNHQQLKWWKAFPLFNL